MRIPALRQAAYAVFIVALSFANWSCGGPGPSVPPPGASAGTGYVFIADSPPPGTTILKFEITLSSATLCPTVGSAGECQGSSQVSLIDSPVDIDLDRLQLQSAFLSTKSVKVGTYAGVKLVFSNYDLELMLADGSIVEFQGSTQPLNSASVTPTFPSVLTVTNNTSFAFLIDFDMNSSMLFGQGGSGGGPLFSGIAPVVSLLPLPLAAQQTVQDMQETKGQVSNLTKTCPTGSFSLTDSLTGATIANISFDDTTVFGEATDEVKDITCTTFASGQIVTVDLEAFTNARNAVAFFAKEIELVGAADAGRFEGTVFQVNTSSQFVLFVEDEDNLPTAPAGSLVTISFNPATVQFHIAASDLPVASTDFATGNDLLAGQPLKVDVTAGSLDVKGTDCTTVAKNCTAQADSLTLRQTTITGRVAGTIDPNFTVDTLPSIFGTPSLLLPVSADCQLCTASPIQVTTTSSSTIFESPLVGVAGLAVNSIVNVRGLLIKNGFTGPGPTSGFPPQLVAARVRLQP